MKSNPFFCLWSLGVLIVGLVAAACQPQAPPVALAISDAQEGALPEANADNGVPVESDSLATPLPTRPAYAPGELVEYIVQTGDTLPALAAHFNTQVDEIREANPIIPENVTTLPPGMPMNIPIYYAPLWGSAYQIMPDSLFVNGPSQVAFDTDTYIANQPGWLKNYVGFAAGANRSGARIVDI